MNKRLFSILKSTHLQFSGVLGKTGCGGGGGCDFLACPSYNNKPLGTVRDATPAGLCPSFLDIGHSILHKLFLDYQLTAFQFLFLNGVPEDPISFGAVPEFSSRHRRVTMETALEVELPSPGPVCICRSKNGTNKKPAQQFINYITPYTNQTRCQLRQIVAETESAVFRAEMEFHPTGRDTPAPSQHTSARGI